jgi:muscarinic acetylcholine receptor M3
MAAFGFSTTPSTTTSAAAISSSLIYLTSLPTHNNSYTNFTSPLTSILSTGPPESVSWASIFLILVMGALSVFTVLGNLIVLLSYYIDKNIRQPSNYFIFSLAVSDLVIGLEGIPVYTYFFINNQNWPFGAFLCDLWLSIDYACCLASIYTVLGITIDRYCSVKYPAAYRNWRTPTKVMLIIAFTWIIPSVLFSILIFGYSSFSGNGRILKETECYVQFMTNAYLNMGMYIAYYWSTLFLMLYLYYGIYCAAKQLASKNDQKQKRLAVLSEMRKRKEPTSTLGASEAALSNNSVAESPGDTSDSAFSRTFKSNFTSNCVTSGNGKTLQSTTDDKSTEREVTAPLHTSQHTSETDRETTGAFQIDEEIPFIDEESITSLVKSDSFKTQTRVHSKRLHQHYHHQNNNNFNSNNNHIPSRPLALIETKATIEITIDKEPIAPLTVRRLLTVMRSKSHRRRKRRKLAKNTHSRSENRAKKALRTITVILGTFTVLWTPWYVLATIYGFCERCTNSPNFNALYTISYYLCYMNSPINPLCYAMANQQFKRTFKRILSGDLRRT